ncbi:acyl-coenzyme A synthetase/AMP-(fatty) acid ligase [Luteibacter rhizovicinus]|uniref:Acyl-coenzyme A synthetase/AMP-(Fatty) acid ligase n=1 Tax=Luteibacter rhizovicinus TaxID=242606 RepID=A0A4R3YXV4_9GAMM|nr:AMP-binding protein [Luteibacter rhizovicinus]TCV96304.1 acyl-coenzyme A synthetase/AMP-(fatty) acid ligase [Luteibacter rhizovicinus]
MSIVCEIVEQEGGARLPLVLGPAGRIVAWRDGRGIDAATFLSHVRYVAAALPDAPSAVNLCEDRYAFLVAFCALVLRGQTNLLPPSRAPRAVDEVLAAHPGSYALGEQVLEPAPAGYLRIVWPDSAPDALSDDVLATVPADRVVAIGYTSGSTGKPKPNVKTWGGFHASNLGNVARLSSIAGEAFHVVATVPPQHMYGMEMSVVMPLFSRVSVHAARPFFPADVAATLASVPPPRVLVITPVHLRTLVEADIDLPPLAAFVSATAPMPVELAQAAERRFGAPLHEVFGSTETCVFASRRTATDDDWSLYDGVRLHPQPDGTLVEAPQLDAPIALADIVTLHDDGRRFRLRGRNTDLLEIAGKRASLGDLNRRLLAIPGVLDGVVFQLDDSDIIGVRRIAALVVAPDLDEQSIALALRQSIDPVFLPRPLRKVQALPRNETGKLPRSLLLEMLGRVSS